MNSLIQPVITTSPAPSLGLEVHDQALTQSLVSKLITQPEAPENLFKTSAVKKPRGELAKFIASGSEVVL